MKWFGRWTWVVIAAGVVVAGAVVVGRPLIQRRVLMGAVGAGRSPSVGAMDAFVGTYGDPAEGLEVLWDSGGVNQRDYVVEYLHRGFVPGSGVWKKFRGRVVGALSFPDEELRQDAFLLLEKERDGEVGALALPLLRDADPEVRIMALHAIAASGEEQYLPAVGGLLADGEAAVRVQAAATVVKVAGLKVGAGETVEQVAATWWAGHRREGVAVARGSAAGVGEFPMAPELRVVDLKGEVVDLRELRGKVVLLNFWATWCGPCVEELPTLEKVAAKHAGEVVVIGICIDAAPDDDGDSPGVSRGEVAAKIERLCKEKGVTYRMAVDEDGRAMNAFGGEAVPTSVLIDGKGRIRRRLVGGRSEGAWEGMIGELR